MVEYVGLGIDLDRNRRKLRIGRMGRIVHKLGI